MNRLHLIACLVSSLALPALADEAPTAKQGASVFKSRCASCHGAGGKGDGPAARALPTKPANLSLSRAPDDYMKLLIMEGGDAMGRSAAMPAWGKVLTGAEVDSLILHINTLRPSLK